MKTKQMRLHRIPFMVCMVFLMAVIFMPVVSCRKAGTSPVLLPGLQNIAQTLQGEIISGSVSTESDEDGIALWCNDGKTLIGLEKIPSQGFANPGGIQHAQVIYSNYGIVIHDTDTGRRWYYIQNDETSQERFHSLQSSGSQPVVSGIAGTIKLNISRGS